MISRFNRRRDASGSPRTESGRVSVLAGVLFLVAGLGSPNGVDGQNLLTNGKAEDGLAGGLYFTLLNPTSEPKQVRMDLDYQALGVSLEHTAANVLEGTRFGTGSIQLTLPAEDVAIISIEQRGEGT